MFLFDASITLLLAYLGYKYLPDYPHNTEWLTERERWVATQRVKSKQEDSHLSQLTKIEKLRLLIKNKYLYAFIFGWASIHIALGASTVLGIVIKKLGHDAITANLLTTVSFLSQEVHLLNIFIVARYHCDHDCWVTERVYQ